MTTDTLKRYRSGLITATLLLTLTGVPIARSAFAKLSANTVDPVGVLAQQGRQVRVTGPVAATAGERIELRVTVTQRSTGAVAEGIGFFTGTGQLSSWGVSATSEGSAAFEPGSATVVALARTSTRGQATDAHQWLVNVTLVPE